MALNWEKTVADFLVLYSAEAARDFAGLADLVGNDKAGGCLAAWVLGQSLDLHTFAQSIANRWQGGSHRPIVVATAAEFILVHGFSDVVWAEVAEILREKCL